VTLAYGVLRDGGVCARVGDRVVDLSGLDPVFAEPSLNAFMAKGPEFWRETAARVERGYELGPAELGMPVEVAATFWRMAPQKASDWRAVAECKLVEAMTEQARKVSFAYRSHFTSGAAEALAKKLSELAPGDLNWSFFVNSGSEATETAMKIAIQHWQEKGFERKNRIISRWTSYHGITMGALSMSGHVPRRKRFVPLLEDFPSISAPYCYRCPHNNETSGCKLKCADELETAIQRVGSENIAAFIAEPIIGASAGAVTPPDGYYQRIKEICETYDILFIADEVMTGIGRTGKMFAMEHWGVTPDIIALGKGMSAGYTPIAATMITDRVMEPILKGSKSIMAGHTYSANPLSAAISLEVLSYIEPRLVVCHSPRHGLF
jgi:adenosylmethionine-8-amino-7-oxononanoate aminotransferase